MVTVRIRNVTVTKAGLEHCVISFDVIIVVMASTASVTTAPVSVRKAGMANTVLWMVVPTTATTMVTV